MQIFLIKICRKQTVFSRFSWSYNEKTLKYCAFAIDWSHLLWYIIKMLFYNVTLNILWREIKISKETGIIQSDVADIVQLTLDNIAQELIEGRDIELRNFGVFEIKIRKSRKGRNPRDTSNEVIIPERAVVKFRAGKELKEAVEKLNPADFR